MIKEVSAKIRLSIKGRNFVLVWDDEKNSPYPCDRCALLGDFCKNLPHYSLLNLCNDLVEEWRTFFVEDKPEEETADADSSPISLYDPYADPV